MIRFIFISLICFFSISFSAFGVTIEQMEYFFDNDPGFGNGIEIPLQSGQETVDINIDIDLSSLSVGFHSLYIRARDDTGSWGIAHIHPFFKLEDYYGIISPQITTAEYFFDTDPGFGNGTPVPLTAGGNIIIDFTMQLDKLADGFHVLNLRAQDGSGNWGIVHKHPIFKLDQRFDAPSPIVKLEYAFDSDPGLGNATPFPVSPGENISAEIILDMSTLSIGNHPFYIRALDENGNWGLTLATTINKYIIGYYPLDGNAEDGSGMENHGAIEGGALPTNNVFGAENSAYLLDGVDDTIAVSASLDDINLSDNTVMMWFKPATDLDRNTGEAGTPGGPVPETAQVLFGRGDDWVVYYNRGFLFGRAATTSGVKTVSYKANLNAGQWHYIALTYSTAGTLNLFLNGLPIGTATGAAEPISTTGTSLFIGSTESLGTNIGFFSGAVDQVSILNHAMTEAEMAEFFYSLQPVTVTPTFLTLAEPDGTADFMVRLAKEPVGEVIVRMASSNPGEFRLSRDTVTLDPINWETGETVTLTAEWDGIFDGAQPASVLTFATLGDDPNAAGYDPSDVKVTVLDDTTTLGIDSGYPTISTEGDDASITLTGINFSAQTQVSLIPYSFSGDEIPITPITFIDGRTLQFTIPGQSQGSFSIKVSETGKIPFTFPDAISFEDDPTVAALARKEAIIVAGSGPYRDNLLWDASVKLADHAYYTLYTQGYTHDQIHYLSHSSFRDIDGDGVNDVDAALRTATLQTTINSLANSPPGTLDEVILFMTGQGNRERFELDGQIDPVVYLNAETLDAWLDGLQSKTGARVIFVYDACWSGSFLPAMIPPAGQERIVISGSSPEDRTYFLDDGEISFSYWFWRWIFNKATLYQSFLNASRIMTGLQTPLLDADGDGLADTPLKRSIDDYEEIEIGRGRNVEARQPEVGEVSPEQKITEGMFEDWWAQNITADNKLSRVWTRLTSPFERFQPKSRPIMVLPTIKLLDDDKDGNYDGGFEKFREKGGYGLYIYARDRKDLQSLPSETAIIQENGQLYFGDFNGDVAIDLKDLLLTLGLLVDLDAEFHLEADTNEDGKIGMEDAIYLMQWIGGLKE